MKNLLTLLIFTSSIAFAQSSFDGTWEMKMDTVQLSGPGEEYLLKEGMFDCLSCVPKIHVELDSNEHKVAGYPSFDTISVHVLDVSSVEFILKKEGKITFTCNDTVSPDGNRMTQKFTQTSASDPVSGQARFVRVSSGPVGAHPLSGAWQLETVRNDSISGPTTVYKTTKDGLRVSAGAISYDARFDGKDYPVEGYAAQTVSLKMIGADTIEETKKQDGKVVRVTRITLSSDGKELRVESQDKQRGGTMTYKAERQQ